MNKARTTIGALTLSAAALVGLALQEGYTDKAVQPLPGDKWTNGFGSTTNDAGQALKPGEAVTPPQALARKLRDIQAFESQIKLCVNVPLHQHEYDAFTSMIYNVGPGKEGVSDGFCYLKRGGNSTLVKRLNAGDYAGACAAISDWTMFQGKDCRDPANRCAGLVKRRAAERAMCEGRTS